MSLRTPNALCRAVGAALAVTAAAAAAQPPAATVTPLRTQPLIGIDGKEGTMLVVEYAPGVASAAHRHNANTCVYVLEGSVIMQVSGGELLTLAAGQTFYETPSDVHAVSRNASDTEPARILVFMVKDVGAPATVPAN
jgi:quercetin dioxygenase-like cupin family protein